MASLLARYLAKPSFAHTIRVAQYDRKHPMARVGLTHLEQALLSEARAVASQKAG